MSGSRWAPVRKYLAVARIQLRASLAYPVDAWGRALLIVLFVLVFLHLWRATYQGKGAVLAGLTLHDVMWYLAIAETVMLSQPRTASLLSQAVKDGSIAYQLARPYDFLLFQMAARAGDTLPVLAPTLLAGGAAAWLSVGPPSAWAGLLVLPLEIGLSWLLSFLMSAAIGLLAFVAEDTSAFEWMFNKLLLVAGGVMIPLDFFPGWAQRLAAALPFAGSVYAPARLFVHPDLATAAALASVQLAWIVLLGAMVTGIYRWGLQRLTVNGG
jgi:ABC-2 type transport system permease protein